ncbi:probable N-acetyltransferase CML1 isoform X1 [Octodon degus]|uniref:Probable N-acetyltransferase CML1 isoform X1 n=1 Tax=Octodon degus TaxID=10160 RepID=A0A6P6EPI0_OCTDE|nr:probable N-acetyltransferase CML1 isoform X1 [Octodon degus]XP_023574164.1 probable N-acetyltransferase CML1 isoform X1 [Octodon degus]XP_023574165.1 probable N-acetyltransferase CML1 isoform X1 [Octodon degus]XP_023574166.1 probable N-acetyltransferase CML1 isoform X1 [Octodon degus]
MAPYHIRKYQESDRIPVVDLFYKGMVEHIPTTFRHTLMLPRTLVFLAGVPLCILLVSGSWLLAFLSSFTLLVFLRLLVGYPWKQYVLTCLRTDMADITKTYLSASDSCFWVAESGGQVVGTVCALPVENPPPGKKQLQLFHLSVAMEHRGEGIAKALVRTVLQFARDQGYGEVVLGTSMVQQSALALYLRMGFQETRQSYFNISMRLVANPIFHLTYQLPTAGHGGTHL